MRQGQSVILLPARLSPIKGHETFIRALGVLEKAGQALPLTLIVGDDQGRAAYTQSLVDLIEQENLIGSVKLVGACADMAAAYALASLVVVPSQVPEGFGRVPVEAMAMGVPVIASALGAIKDTVLEDKTGWLVTDDWAEATRRAIVMSLSERDAMAATARAHVEANFDVKKMIAKTLAVYDEVIK